MNIYIYQMLEKVTNIAIKIISKYNNKNVKLKYNDKL